ncbi:hypothetical protein JCM19992_31340 [Thermostilla marina]
MNEALKERRERIRQELQTEEGRRRIIARLKELKGIPPHEPLPNGTPIITELIRLEDAHQAGAEAAAPA